MIRVLTVLFSAMLLAGCVSQPAHNQDFAQIRSLKDLEGVYDNNGQVEAGRFGVLLSEVIWPSTQYSDLRITAVEVRRINEHALRVRAWSDRVLAKEEVFWEGKDFGIADGRLVIRNHVVTGPGVDVKYEKTELGIDQSGQGKYKSEGVLVTMALLFVPTYGGKEARFTRIGN